MLCQQEAKRILALFGSCTITYECNEAGDLVEEFKEGQFDGTPFLSINAFVVQRFEIEKIMGEQQMDCRGEIDRPDKEHQTEVDEYEQLLEDARLRLNEAGYEVPK